MLVDERDPGTSPRVLFYLEHAIQDASLTAVGRAPRHLAADALRRDGRRRGTRATCTTRPTSTTGRSPRASPAVADLLARPECAWITREPGAEGAGPRHRPRRARAPRRGARPAARAGSRRPRRGEGPADQGDHLLGPPRRAAQAPGAGRQGQRAAQLAARPAGAPTTCRRGSQKRLAELDREAPDLGAAAGRAGRPRGRAARADRRDDRARARRRRRRRSTPRQPPPAPAPS